MKNTLNEILSMMSRIDPSYVYEDGEGEEQENFGFTPEILKEVYEDRHYPLFVKFIDSIHNNEDLTSFLEYVKRNGLVGAETFFIQGKNVYGLSKNTVGNIILTVYKIYNQKYNIYLTESSSINNHIVSNIVNEEKERGEHYNYGSFISQNTTNARYLANQLFDTIKTTIVSLLGKTFDVNSMRQRFYTELFSDVGITYSEENSKEIDTLFDKIIEKTEGINKRISKHQSLGNEIDPQEINDDVVDAVKDVQDFMVKNNLYLDKNTENDAKKAKNITNISRITKYDGIPQVDDHNPNNSGNFLLTNPLGNKQNLGKNANGSSPSVLRKFFPDKQYERLRAYLYYSDNKMNGYSDGLRKYIFGNGNCLSEETKILNYDSLKWDDPLYGDTKNDPNYMNNALVDLFNLLVNLFNEKSPELISEELISNMTNKLQISDTPSAQRGNTVYETIQFIMDAVKNGHLENPDLMSKLNPSRIINNKFSDLCIIFDYILNYDYYSYIFNIGVSVPEIMNNVSLQYVANKNGADASIDSIFPDKGLFKYDSKKEYSTFGILDYIQQTTSFITAKESERKKLGDKIEGEVKDFCTQTMLNCIKKILENKKMCPPDADLNLYATTICEKNENLYWEKIGKRESNSEKNKEESEKMFGTNTSSDLGNRITSTLIEIQGPYHFCFSSNGVVNPSLKNEEFLEENRRNAYLERRDRFFEFIKEHGVEDKNERGLYLVTEKNFIDLQKKYVKEIKEEFEKRLRAGNTVDEYGVEINEMLLGKEIKPGIEQNASQKPYINEKTRLNSLKRWFAETFTWKKELNDNVKIWQACDTNARVGIKKAELKNYSFIGQSRLIHLIANSSLIRDDSPDFETIINNYPVVKSPKTGKDTMVSKRLSAISYALRYGKYLPKYALKTTDNTIQLKDLSVLDGANKGWLSLYQGAFEVMIWNKDNKKLKDLIENQYINNLNKIEVEIQNTYNTLKEEGVLKESYAKTLFTEIIEEILKNGEC